MVTQAKNEDELKDVRERMLKEKFIRKFKKGTRPEVIIAELSKRFFLKEQTIRGIIKPAKLKKDIKEGKI